jgi:small nuclear ribonucleoprotein D3
MSISIPRATVADAIGQEVTVEMLDGMTYRGKLEAVDERFNVRLALALVRAKSGAYSAAGNVTLSGTKLKMLRLPDAMRDAPFFKEVVSGAIAARAKRRKQSGPKAGKKTK